ncbi:MAG: hypothetical protein K9N51_03580 [Candidatus Pacebacteria bacterium]|nr:hypothetical protein [Candidatus Paceibacterota bacterium]
MSEADTGEHNPAELPADLDTMTTTALKSERLRLDALRIRWGTKAGARELRDAMLAQSLGELRAWLTALEKSIPEADIPDKGAALAAVEETREECDKLK